MGAELSRRPSPTPASGVPSRWQKLGGLPRCCPCRIQFFSSLAFLFLSFIFFLFKRRDGKEENTLNEEIDIKIPGSINKIGERKQPGTGIPSTQKICALQGMLTPTEHRGAASGGLRLPAAVSPEPGSSSPCVRSGKRLPAAGGTRTTELTSGQAPSDHRRAPGSRSPRPSRTGRPDPIAYWIAARRSDLQMCLLAARVPRRAAATALARAQSRAGRGHLHPAGRLLCTDQRPVEIRAYLEQAPAEAQFQARGKSRSPHPPPPSSQVSAARRGPGRHGSAPASPFSSDAFDPRALRRTSARELPGSARGDPGNRPRFISFHQAALGSLETAEPVIAFFRRPGADWITANQRLVYT